MALSGQLPLKLEQRQSFARETFIVTPANLVTVSALDVWPGPRSGALALIGPCGSGKTHLATAWAARTGARPLTPLQVDGGDVDWAAGPVLLDDADQSAHDEGFFHLLNAASRPGACLLMTGRSRPATWPVQVQDLRSRLNAASVVELGEPDEEILKGMLVRLFQQRNIRAPDDLLAYLILRMERSAAAAAQMVEALDVASLAEQRGVSRGLARQILKDEADDGEPTAQR